MPPGTIVPVLSIPNAPERYSIDPTRTASENGSLRAASDAETGKYSTVSIVDAPWSAASASARVASPAVVFTASAPLCPCRPSGAGS